MSGTNALSAGASQSAPTPQISAQQPAITDPNMSAADWAHYYGGIGFGQGSAGGGEPAGVPSSQWGPFGITPPPGSPAAKEYWSNLQYGDSPPPGAVPMDPTQYTNMYEGMTANTSHYGGGMQVPVGVSGSEFNPTQGNPNFTINPAGYGELTDQGSQNLNNYAQNQLQSIYANAAKNRAGLSGFLGTPMGGLAMLAFPTLVGGGAAALSGALAGGAAGGGAAAGGAGAAGAAAPSGLAGFIANPLASLGLPGWVSPSISTLNTIRQLLGIAQQQQQGGQ